MGFDETIPLMPKGVEHGFDFAKLVNGQFVPREDILILPDLRVFFSEGEEPKFTVRGLTGHEFGRVQEAIERNKGLSEILDGLTSAIQKEKIEALKASIGLSEKTPNEIVKRIQLLILGSVNPKFEQEGAVRLCKYFPIEFYQLTNKITELTGQGHVPGKQKPSGEIRESGRP